MDKHAIQKIHEIWYNKDEESNEVMKNTVEKGTFNFRIFKWNDRYIGICRETGFVEESEDFDVVYKKLHSGTRVLLEAVKTSKQDLTPSLNTSPPLKYTIYFYIAPLLSFIEFLKDSQDFQFASFNEPIVAGG